MALRPRSHRAYLAALLTFLPLASVSGSALAQANAHLFAQAESVTDEDASKTVEATVWLKMHNKQALDSAVAGMYQAGSPTYHQWLKKSDLARFVPTAAEAQAVRRDLINKGLAVTVVDKNSMFVKVKGSVGTMQSAFNTQIKTLSVKGDALHATTTEPTMSGSSADLVSNVTGLTQRAFHPYSVRPKDPDTGKAYPGVPASSSPKGVFFASDCFRGVQTQIFKTPGAVLPVGVFGGSRYGADITNTTPGTLAPCGYGFTNVATAYGLTDAYSKGLDGTGQTIVIVDAYGSPTIADDANTFSQINGLPALTSSNFQVIYPLGPANPTTPDNLAGWQDEISLDVEWAHAAAPGANIILLVSPDDYDNNLQTCVFYSIASELGNIISNSYGGPEYGDSPEDLFTWSSVNELGAALGVAVNYSTGDEGDQLASAGAVTVSSPSDSPYATAIGGTSLGINANNKIKFQTGWGTNLTKLAKADGTPLDPPLQEGFIYGAGGGESQFFAKPSWQSALPGRGRQQPDISLVADPYTGVEIIFTSGGQQLVGAIGGTSVSCPIFSGIWAIANQLDGQLHGKGSTLGQAAPIIAGLAGSSAITDVLPASSPTNVAGFIYDNSGVTFYPPDQLADPLENTKEYLGELYNSPSSGSWFDITFGTDSSLVTAKGWDNVTGFGTPNGLTFINAVAK